MLSPFENIELTLRDAKGEDYMRLRALLSMILVCTWVQAGEIEEEKPLEIGSRLELFVDDYLIEFTDGVELQLQEPASAGKILTFDKPWEGTTSLYHTVFKDGDIYRMYYRGSSHDGYSNPAFVGPGETVIPVHPEVGCYIESKDGITWTRPSLGLIEFEGSKDNNIVWIGKGGHNFAPFKDGNPKQRLRSSTRPSPVVPSWP